MFSQRKTEVSYGNTIPRNFDVRFGMLRKTFKIEFGVLELWSLWSLWSLCSEIFKVLNAKKKLAWTGLDRVNFKKKIFKESDVENEKSAWTGLDKVKKGLFSSKCLLKVSSRLVLKICF